MGVHDLLVRGVLAQVAPGTALREGLERILHAHMGALIVLGDGPEVLAICSGGFHIDAEMSPQRLSELAKMDGAIILNTLATRIAWANVHLVPDPSAPTSETGTRHRTAERVARCVEVPVVAVSEEMGTITLYRGEERRQLRATDALIARANQLLAALRRFRERLDEVLSALDASEVEDVVTFGDVAVVLQRTEMVLHVAEEIGDLLGELGEHGRLLALQLDELASGVDDEERLILDDYFGAGGAAHVASVRLALKELSTEALLAVDRIIEACTGVGSMLGPDDAISARGRRLLRRVRQLPEEQVTRLVEHFGDLHRLLRAPLEELADVGAMTEEEARALKAGLGRLAESSILDRFG